MNVKLYYITQSNALKGISLRFFSVFDKILKKYILVIKITSLCYPKFCMTYYFTWHLRC